MAPVSTVAFSRAFFAAASQGLSLSEALSTNSDWCSYYRARLTGTPWPWALPLQPFLSCPGCQPPPLQASVGGQGTWRLQSLKCCVWGWDIQAGFVHPGTFHDMQEAGPSFPSWPLPVAGLSCFRQHLESMKSGSHGQSSLASAQSPCGLSARAPHPPSSLGGHFACHLGFIWNPFSHGAFCEPLCTPNSPAPHCGSQTSCSLLCVLVL